MKDIGIIGSGVVAKALAKGFEKYGYTVMLGSRTPEKLHDFTSQFGDNVTEGTFEETAAFGDIVVLAVKGTVAKDVVEMAGLENIGGKTVIDACNPIADAPPEDGVLRYFTDMNSSLMEELQQICTGARFVKAFSTVNSAFMVNPPFESKPSMFICGDDEDAKAEVKAILDQFGWESEDMGTAKAARAIEPMAMLYCIPGIQKHSWNHAFKLLRH
jgi:predicted dinucleotide-binding enzyme